VPDMRPYTNSTTAIRARCRTRDIGMSPSWSSEWASQKMVGPRFSVNALAETKFIFRPEGDDRLLANAQEVSNPPAGNLTRF
jgi:hypothetical protein